MTMIGVAALAWTAETAGRDSGASFSVAMMARPCQVSSGAQETMRDLAFTSITDVGDGGSRLGRQDLDRGRHWHARSSMAECNRNHAVP